MQPAIVRRVLELRIIRSGSCKLETVDTAYRPFKKRMPGSDEVIKDAGGDGKTNRATQSTELNH